MKKSAQPLPVKLVTGFLFREDQWLRTGLEDLAGKFGEIDFHSETIPFRYTDYYFREMGEPLYRKFVSFQTLFDAAQLMEIKVFTNSLEEKYLAASGGKRVLNLDPGYLNATAYILATSKNYSHRIYLGKGVFAQQELLFEKNRIQTLDWTYPDYRTVEYQDIFRKIRAIYSYQTKNLQKSTL
jgi:hypothetical protein